MGEPRGGDAAGAAGSSGARVRDLRDDASRADGLRGGVVPQERGSGRRGRERVVGWVPVFAGDGAGAALARVLGVPVDPVAAARAVLDGRPVARDLLVDDSDGVVLGALVLPVPGARGRGGALRRLGGVPSLLAGHPPGPRVTG
ncbi:hypothetical protein G3I42_28565, partial [Streptomyces sp. SID11385]|nr:hypothetical protein [Streptomyces sp. SID11385]